MNAGVALLQQPVTPRVIGAAMSNLLLGVESFSTIRQEQTAGDNGAPWRCMLSCFKYNQVAVCAVKQKSPMIQPA